MNDSLELLQGRNSAPRLTEPGPDPDTLEQMFAAALRAPDHAWLQPWRFIVISGPEREALGEVFLKALLAREPDAEQAKRDKATGAPLRAPMLVVAVCRYTEHPKVPHREQLMSAGCAAHAMLLAAEARGYAGMWRTGPPAEDAMVARELGLGENESIVGFLYFGSREGDRKKLPPRPVDEYVSYWTADADHSRR